MTLDVIAAFAEFERDLLIERTQSCLARAKSQGESLGRPRSLDDTKINFFELRLSEGKTVAALAQELCTSRQSIMRIRRAAHKKTVSQGGYISSFVVTGVVILH